MLGASADALVRELIDWLDRLLAWQVALTSQRYGAIADDEHRGLYVPEAEALLLAEGVAAPAEALANDRHALARERVAIGRAPVSASSPLVRLAQLFGLSDFECDVLLLALLPELTPRYERLFGYIQDDITKKRPTVDLALGLLCVDVDQTLAARAAFAPDAPLLAHRIVQLYDDGQRYPSLLTKFIRLDERIVGAILELAAIDPELADYVALTEPDRALDRLVLPDELRSRLRQMVAARRSGLVLALQGGYGSGRKAIAEGLCAEAGLPLLVVSGDRLVQGGLAPEDAARRLVREAALQGAAILWQHGDALLGDDDLARQWRAAVVAVLDDHAGLTFVALERTWDAQLLLRRARFLRVELPPLSYAGREQLWRERLGADGLPDATLRALASTFRLSGGQIRDAAAMARTLVHWRDGDGPARAEIGLADLYAACRAQTSGRLDGLAQKITATYTWADLVLPAEAATQLREICLQVRHRRTVLERWGFDRHLAMGKGVNVLFSGQSGTGKTMAAEIIAADLGLELYKVNLSALVSKYIGETEKNLERIFQAAGQANAILFFDEADAIFGKRSEVKDAHDRYANIEVGYLLQRMEEYDGVVVLSTNLRKNIDDAFVRRLHVAVDFPFPDEPDRLRIWRNVFPPDAPLAGDVDLQFLSRQFKLAGGNIRNIALLAAFLAAEDGETIGMSHIVRALKREYQKLGKLVTEAEFGAYLPLLRRDAGGQKPAAPATKPAATG